MYGRHSLEETVVCLQLEQLIYHFQLSREQHIMTLKRNISWEKWDPVPSPQLHAAQFHPPQLWNPVPSTPAQTSPSPKPSYLPEVGRVIDLLTAQQLSNKIYNVWLHVALVEQSVQHASTECPPSRKLGLEQVRQVISPLTL